MLLRDCGGFGRIKERSTQRTADVRVSQPPLLCHARIRQVQLPVVLLPGSEQGEQGPFAAPVRTSHPRPQQGSTRGRLSSPTHCLLLQPQIIATTTILPSREAMVTADVAYSISVTGFQQDKSRMALVSLPTYNQDLIEQMRWASSFEHANPFKRQLQM